jgi:hypothetical protein
VGRDLTPTGGISQNPVAEGCELLSTETFTAVTIQIYPNPTVDFLNIEGANPESHFVIYDLNGRQMSTHTTKSIDLSRLSSGIYLLEVRSSDQTIVRKFIKK